MAQVGDTLQDSSPYASEVGAIRRPLAFPAVILVKFCAPNDRAGNPRRAWVALNPSPVAAWCDDYHGHHACPPNLRNAAQAATTVNVTWAELKRLMAGLPSPLFWDGVKLPGEN